MDILREVIFEQNNKLLKQISEDFYPDMEKEQTQFIYDYNKKNDSILSHLPGLGKLNQPSSIFLSYGKRVADDAHYYCYR